MKTAKQKATEHLENFIDSHFSERSLLTEKFLEAGKEAIEIVSQPDWIKCSERLPELGVEVLTCITADASSHQLDWLEKDENLGDIYWYFGNHIQPTYWLLLPSPPKI